MRGCSSSKSDTSLLPVPAAAPGCLSFLKRLTLTGNIVDVATTFVSPQEIGNYFMAWQLVDDKNLPMCELEASYSVSNTASPMKVKIPNLSASTPPRMLSHNVAIKVDNEQQVYKHIS